MNESRTCIAAVIKTDKLVKTSTTRWGCRNCKSMLEEITAGGQNTGIARKRLWWPMGRG